MIYIHKNLSYKRRKDLNIYKPKAIESTFTEVINDKRLNTIIGCICKHPKTTVNEFNYFMLLKKLSLKEKEIILMGDFNKNLLHSDIDKETTNNLVPNNLDNLYQYVADRNKVKLRNYIDW